MQETKEYQNLILGFGKAGKTLAGLLAKRGESVALVERSKERYGGTCINVACIPSKSLEYSARLSAAVGGDFAARAARYRAASDGDAPPEDSREGHGGGGGGHRR